MKWLTALFEFLFATAVAMLAVKVNIHAGSSCPHVWAVVDFFFSPIALLKWLICHQINVSVLKETFGFLLG